MTAVLDTPEQIEMFRYKTLLRGLRLETLGMQMSRGRSCYSIIKQEFGLKGSKQKVFDQFKLMLEQVERKGSIMTASQVEARVESWNWNMNIFEIYDELRDGHTRKQQEDLLSFAYRYFNKDKMILELASHFGVYNIEDNENE
jgi:hypothetical protein